MRIISAFFLALSFSFCLAQNEMSFNDKLFGEVLSFLEKEKKVTTDKLISINVWSPVDKTSRELNVEFEKANSIYFKARLKGGIKGVVSVIFCLDKDEVKSSIALNKDGIAESIYIVKADPRNTDLAKLLKDKPPGFNIVFDRDGKVVYEGIKKGAVFLSFNKLVTR